MAKTKVNTFKFNDRISFECKYQKRSNGFAHVASLLISGKPADTVTVGYTNRTWESFEYQSAMQSLVDKTKVLTKQEKQSVHEFLRDYKEDNNLGVIAGIAMLGDLFGNTKKESNDWKARMLKAGLGEGIQMPDDWNTLSEEEKQRRLDGAIKILKVN